MVFKDKICPFCEEKIFRVAHLKKCNKNVNEITAYKLMIEKTFNCVVEEVLNDYLNGLSLPDIKEKYGISYKATQKLLENDGYSLRTIKESCNDKRLSKYLNTIQEKFSVDNVSKSDIIKDRKRKTFIKNYGVDNTFKTEGFTEHVSLICLEKYGKKRITNGKLNSEKRALFTDEKWESINRKIRETYQKKYENGWQGSQFSSTFEEKIKDCLDKNNIQYEQQKYVNGRSYDFHIINTDILIEVNGDYWHANPKFYNSDDKINYPGGKRLAKEVWDKDMLKKENAEKYEYILIYLWESDINECLKNKTINEFLLSNLVCEVKTE